MNTDIKNDVRHLTVDEIRKCCIEIEGEPEDEKTKLIIIEEEFRQGIDTIKELGPSATFYGSARLKEDHPDFIKVTSLARRIGKELNYAILSGGGGGMMEAANKGAKEAGVESVGLTIKLPKEQHTNPYVTKEIPFHFFFARQVSMSYTTEVCIFCTGGFGTFYELFEMLTLQQTGKIGKIPVILYGTEYWGPINDLIKKLLVEKYNTVNEKELELYTITDSEDEVIEIIKKSKMRNGEDSLI